MTVLLVLSLFAVAIGIDYFRKVRIRVPAGTCFTTPGYEMLGAFAQDGGERVDNFLGEGI